MRRHLPVIPVLAVILGLVFKSEGHGTVGLALIVVALTIAAVKSGRISWW
jgi:hypothetical protein